MLSLEQDNTSQTNITHFQSDIRLIPIVLSPRGFTYFHQHRFQWTETTNKKLTIFIVSCEMNFFTLGEVDMPKYKRLILVITAHCSTVWVCVRRVGVKL